MCFLWKKLKGYYKNLKIQQKLTFSHLIIVLIPMLVIGVFFYTSLYDMIVSNTIRSEQERAAKTAPLVEDAVKEIIDVHRSLKMSTLNSTFFHVFIVLPFCTIRSLFYCIFSLLGSAIVRLPLLPTSHAPYFRSYASCFTSSSNSSPAE